MAGGATQSGLRENSAPEGPTDLSAGSWLESLKRAGKEFQADDCTDRAASLTYYSVLSLFPAMLVLVALLGVFGQNPETTNSLLDIVRQLGPSSAVDTLEEPIRNVTESGGGAGALLGIGLLGAIWSASGYLGAFSRASNAIYGVEEGRPFWKMRPQQIGMTILMELMLAVTLIGLIITGPVAESVGDVIGVGGAAVTVWDIAKWPVMVLMISLIFALLYYWAPNVKQPRFRWISPGSLVAVVAWILASAGFGLYVANFSSYNATYGAFAGVIVFLLWLWITNNAILFGQELNAELERQREIARGVSGAEEEIQPALRDSP